MRHSLRSLEGELLIDHTASPGLPPDFLQKCGLVGPNVGAGVAYRTSTLMCCHCGNSFIQNPMRTRPRGHCRKCDEYVCDNPACNKECRPWKKVLDDVQEMAARGYGSTYIIGKE